MQALCGDFNSWPEHCACVALKHGLAVGHAEHPGQGCAELRLPGGGVLRSAWAEAHAGCEPCFTRKKNVPASQFCLDYVFLGGGATCVGASFGAGPPPYAAGGDGTDLPQLPCAAWPSDHLPVVVELCLGE